MTWTEAANTFNGARHMTLSSLNSGTTYQVRFCALGGSTGQSQWSNPAAKMVT